MIDRNPFINTAQDVKDLAHKLKERVVDRNLDVRSLSLTKLLHIISEAKDYESWQQYSADLKKHECMNALVTIFKHDKANAAAAWATLSADDIKNANNGFELADSLARTYAMVPLPVRVS